MKNHSTTSSKPTIRHDRIDLTTNPDYQIRLSNFQQAFGAFVGTELDSDEFWAPILDWGSGRLAL